jgi:hypothetical protein
VHGDDFFVLAPEEGLTHFDSLLRSKYTIKNLGTASWEPGDTRTLCLLNRTITLGEDEQGCYIDWEADRRHADTLLKENGLAKGSHKGLATPRERHTREQLLLGSKSALLVDTDVTAYRSSAMRLQYLRQDRADLQELAKFMAQWMKEPTVFDMALVKRACRYLVGRPRGIRRFRAHEYRSEWRIETFSDSDWASCPLTAKSTSGCVSFLNGCAVKTGSNLQSITTLSVGEAEFYALTKGGAVALSLESLLRDLGETRIHVVLRADSTTAKAMTDRLGVGRVRHMQTRWMWLQERVHFGDLQVLHVGTKVNMSDVLTKVLTRLEQDKHLEAIGLIFPANI